MSDEPLELIPPPSYLLEDERAVWERLAPLARERKTLTETEVPGFYALCQAQAIMSQLKAKVIAEDFETTQVTLQMDEKGGGLQQVQKKKHHLLSELRGWAVVVKAGLKDFDITSMGKPRKAKAKERVKSALEQLQTQRPATIRSFR